MRRLVVLCGVFALLCAFGALGAGADPPTVTLSPSAETVCAVSGLTEFQSGTLTSASLQWQSSTDNSTWSDIPGATSNPLSFHPQASDNGSFYRAGWTNTITHEGPAFSTSAQLTVRTETLLTASPSGETVAPGATASFTAAATVNSSTPTPTVQWQVDVPGPSTIWNDIPGATSPTLSFTASGADDGNQYRAVFSDVCGPPISTDSAMLTVQSLPAVTTQPADVGPVSDGAPVSFTAQASGFPAPSVQWQYSFTGGSSWIDLGGETSTTLAFNAGALDDGNEYRAAFTNRVGTTFSAVAALTVQFAPQVVDQPQDRLVCPSGGAGFFSDARADPTATEQWQSSPDGVLWTDIPGATSTSLSFAPSPLDDGEHYRALFTNTFGTTDSDSAALTVATTPTVTLDPVDTTVAPGDPVSFVVAATGHPTPLVGWQSSTDGGASWFPILGQPTTKLTFTPSASADGTEYRAVFHVAECGQVFTSAATLHVVAAVPAPPPPGPLQTTLTLPGPSATLATDGSLPGDVGVLGGAGEVTWPAGAFGPATVSLAQTPDVGNVAGFAAGGDVLSLSVIGSNGKAITSFPAPLVLHMTPAVPPPFVPSYSPDGLSWVPIPQLAAPQLPPGQRDGYFLNPDNSIDIYTLHATYFGVLQDVQAPSAPGSLRASYAAGTLTFAWAA